MKKYTLAILLAASLIVPSLIVDAQAAPSIRVKCERRGDDRSKVSVDAKGLEEGMSYTAQIISGSFDEESAPQTVASGEDQLEFDFDSNQDDIADGATAIDPEFIQGEVVTGKILDGEYVVVSDEVGCRMR